MKFHYKIHKLINYRFEFFSSLPDLNIAHGIQNCPRVLLNYTPFPFRFLFYRPLSAIIYKDKRKCDTSILNSQLQLDKFMTTLRTRHTSENLIFKALTSSFVGFEEMFGTFWNISRCINSI